MNYLAHLYLSGPDPGVKVGNFIGDYVKGNRFIRYNPAIQRGIILHRMIDSFTDGHPVFRESSKLFQPMYRRYAGVVTDIVYDHFLAANWEQFSAQTLQSFVTESHRILMSQYFVLPGTVKQFLPFLIKSRRMEQYQSLQGVDKTLRIMSGNSSLPSHADWTLEQMNLHYNQLEGEFFVFFKEVGAMCKAWLDRENITDRRAI